MNPKKIGECYDGLAEQWNSEGFDRTNGIAQHKRAISFLKKKDYALDIGCGSSGRFIDLLLDDSFHVEGVDISKRMIALAKKRHPKINFHHDDILTWNFSRKYDFITAWDSIWHLPLDEQERTLKKICGGLADRGVLIFTTGGLDGPEEKLDSFMGPQVYYSVLGIPKTLEILLESGCICRHLEYDQYPEQHLYLIAQKT